MNMEINEKEIEQATRKIDLSGFKVQDELNPKIWDEDEKMDPTVRKTLLKIADDYFESLELPNIDIEDVTMTGSLSNYNWSKYSDVDLHILIDYNDLPMDEELVQDFLKSKSSAWNKEHDVKIYGYDVELYVQDIDEEHHSTGVYSILKNEWVTKPKMEKISFNDKSVKDKSNRLMDRIEEIYEEMDEVENEDTIKRVEKLQEKIKKMRQSGLESGGEFSVENIVFKVLRRNGMLDRLYDIKTVAYDKSVTLESNINLSKIIKENSVMSNLDFKKLYNKLKNSFSDFIDKLKQEREETKEAYKLLVNSIKENKTLTREERKQIGDQLKDTLKLAGFTAATVLPGGFVYLLLTRVTKLKKHMVPSAFLNESEDLSWVDNIKETDFWNRQIYVLFKDEDNQHFNSTKANILDSETFELEDNNDFSIYVEGDTEILAEFELVWPNGVSFVALRKILDDIMYNFNEKGIKPQKSYIYDEESSEFIPNR